MNAPKLKLPTPALAVALATLMLAGSAPAQDTGGGSTGSTAGSSSGTTTTRTDDNRTDYSWVGLLGLPGLAGLLKRPKEVHTHETRAVRQARAFGDPDGQADGGAYPRVGFTRCYHTNRNSLSCQPS